MRPARHPQRRCVHSPLRCVHRPSRCVHGLRFDASIPSLLPAAEQTRKSARACRRVHNAGATVHNAREAPDRPVLLATESVSDRIFVYQQPDWREGRLPVPLVAGNPVTNSLGHREELALSLVVPPKSGHQQGRLPLAHSMWRPVDKNPPLVESTNNVPAGGLDLS